METGSFSVNPDTNIPGDAGGIQTMLRDAAASFQHPEYAQMFQTLASSFNSIITPDELYAGVNADMISANVDSVRSVLRSRLQPFPFQLYVLKGEGSVLSWKQDPHSVIGIDRRIVDPHKLWPLTDFSELLNRMNTVTVRDDGVSVTPYMETAEAQILGYLMEHYQHAVFSSQIINNRVKEKIYDDKSITKYVHKINKKISDTPFIISPRTGFGYRLTDR